MMVDIKDFEIVISYKCKTLCASCYANSKPNYNKVIEEEIAINCINNLTNKYNLRTIGFLGGEPTLHNELLLNLISHAKKNQIPNIMMFTNGEWGNDTNVVEKMCAEYKKAGLTEIIISVDKFHQKRISLESCKEIAQTALNKGIRVRYNVCYLEDINAENEVDNRNREIIREISLNKTYIQLQKLRICGRAENLLHHYSMLSSAININKPCNERSYFGPLFEPNGILVDCHGYVQICDGISIGSVLTNQIDEIIEKYNYKDNLITKAIVEEGPIGLLKYTDTKSISIDKKKFVDNCHVCYHLRKLLVKKFPNILSPSHLYV